MNPQITSHEHWLVTETRQLSRLSPRDARHDLNTALIAALLRVMDGRGIVTEYRDLLGAFRIAVDVLAEMEEAATASLRATERRLACEIVETPAQHDLQVTLAPISPLPPMPERPAPLVPTVDPALSRARKWAEDRECPADRGWVVYHLGEAQGWTEQLSPATEFRPGAIAYSLAGGRQPLVAGIAGWKVNPTDRSEQRWLPLEETKAADAIPKTSAPDSRFARVMQGFDEDSAKSRRALQPA